MTSTISFTDLSLSSPILKVLSSLGYETPSPIQAQAIPLFLEGYDLIGQAQTGTGKTAAFALPILNRLDLSVLLPQVLVLTPTRELAIQVAEAFQVYARFIKGFHVLPIYGGQNYTNQLRQLKRGVHVVVGTPGRLIDHLDRGTLDLSGITTLVLDEADEMLRMGFIDDVERIISETPEGCQKAMFSATMPPAIAKIARKYLKNAKELKIESKTTTVEHIDQNYLLLRNPQKLDALTRILESENYDGVIVFVRTKSLTVELAEKLEARGYPVSALNGDMKQSQREQTVRHLKSGKFDILVATDVAARGLDVERVSLVINYDIPLDTEAYVHRIGRTARAGREGKTILLTTPREKHLLSAIEKATRQKQTAMTLPTGSDIAQKRADNFTNRLLEVFDGESLQFYTEFLDHLHNKLQLPKEELAVALLYLAQQDNPLLVDIPDMEVLKRWETKDDRGKGRGSRDKKGHGRPVSIERVTYRLQVGKNHGVKVSDIVGAIANEVDMDSQYIGQIQIFDEHSTVALPKDMPKEVINHLKTVHVRKRPLNLTIQRGDGKKIIRRKVKK